MRQGYLSVETHPDHPDQVRIVPSERPPDTPDATRPDQHAARVRCVVRFEDLDAATMHAHTALRRRLVDIDDHRYRVDPVTAVAAIDAIGLRHQRIHLDPELANDPALARAIEQLRARRQRRDVIWNGVGLTALIWLLMQAILGL